jgi:hypothetical protein
LSIAFDVISDFWEEQPLAFTQSSADEAFLSMEDFSAKYERIIARLKELSINLGTYMWEIGDLLLVADCDYNPQDHGIPSYMLIGSHPPNFWKQMSDCIGLSVASLKLYANVARAFPLEKRIAELTWSHHLAAHVYVDRDKYLRKCVDDGMEESGKPHTIRWLEKYIEEQENCVQFGAEPVRSVTIDLPLSMMKKFSDLAKHKFHKPVKDVVMEAVLPPLEAYLAKMAHEISMRLFEYHDGETWPFGADAKKKLSLKSWKRRDDRKALVTIRRIA